MYKLFRIPYKMNTMHDINANRFIFPLKTCIKFEKITMNEILHRYFQSLWKIMSWNLCSAYQSWLYCFGIKLTHRNRFNIGRNSIVFFSVRKSRKLHFGIILTTGSISFFKLNSFQGKNIFQCLSFAHVSSLVELLKSVSYFLRVEFWTISLLNEGWDAVL